MGTAQLTEQIQVEQELRSPLQPVVQAAEEEALFLVGSDGRVSHFSSRLESLTGIRATDVVGQPHSALF